jgi:hypothetical protein
MAVNKTKLSGPEAIAHKKGRKTQEKTITHSHAPIRAQAKPGREGEAESPRRTRHVTDRMAPPAGGGRSAPPEYCQTTPGRVAIAQRRDREITEARAPVDRTYRALHSIHGRRAAAFSFRRDSKSSCTVSGPEGARFFFLSKGRSELLVRRCWILG